MMWCLSSNVDALSTDTVTVLLVDCNGNHQIALAGTHQQMHTLYVTTPTNLRRICIEGSSTTDSEMDANQGTF